MSDTTPTPAPAVVPAIQPTPDPSPSVPASTLPNKRTAERDTFVIALIGALALADLAAMTFFKVDVHAIETVNGGVFLGLFAFLKGS